MIRCAACGTDSPDAFRFCPGCGAPLTAAPATPPAGPPAAPPAPAREERRVVTILFSDLAGFTSRSEALDPEDARALLVPYYAILEAEITGHGGVVERHIGDGIMALFGAPVAHEDDPERAIRAALRILERIPALGTDLHARIGINTGEILYRSEGQGREDAVTGDAANTAARLQGLAPVDGVVVGEATWRATNRVFEYTEHPPATVKGKAEPIRVFQPTAPRARFGVDLTGTHDTPYVGRRAELAAMTGAFDAVVSERAPRFVTVVAPAGMGKSRFIAQLRDHVDARPGLVTWRQGRCLPYGDGITFWALGEIVKAHAGILESDDPATASARILDALPNSPEREWIHQRLLPLVGVAAGPGAERGELFTAWRTFIAGIPDPDPAVILFEDLHWADEAMIAFIEDLVTNLVEGPLLIVGTARPELFEHHPGFGASLANWTRIDLPPLDDADAAELVAALLGSVVPVDLRVPILERAAGNPLYVEEFVRLLGDRDLLVELDGAASLRPGATLPLPDTIGALLAARLDMLEPDRRALLGNASVIGKVFWSGGVAALAERERAAVDTALAELSDRQLVRLAAVSSMAGEDEYAFWHVLARDVAYNQLPRTARVSLHVAAAKWLESRAVERVEDVAELLAYHWTTALELAKAAGQVDRAANLEPDALRCLLRAGGKALNLDVTAAAASFERALALTPPGHPERPEALARVGQAARISGRYIEAAEALEEAIASFRARGEIHAAARAMGELGAVFERLGDPRRWTTIVERLGLLEPLEPSPQLVFALIDVAGGNTLQSRFEDAIAAADRAMVLASELGLPRPAHALGFRGMARVGLGDRGGLDDFREAIELATEAGDGWTVATLRNNLGFKLWSFEGPVAALEVLGAGITDAKPRGLTDALDGLTACSIECLVDTVEHQEALARAAEMAPRLEASGAVWGLVAIRAPEIRVFALRGQGAEVTDMLEWLEPAARAIGDPQFVVVGLGSAAIVRAALGQHEAAAALLSEAQAYPGARDNQYYPALLAAMVRAALRIGEPALAGRLVDGLEPRYPLAEHALVAANAALTEARGDLEAAADAYADAAARWERFGVVPEQAFALLGQGRCLIGLSRPIDAERVMRQARAIFERLKAAPALEEVNALLAGAA